MTVRRVLTSVTLVVLALLGWLLAAPQQVGGPVAVVTTYGDSMLPNYTASDLVVVSRAHEYAVGDVVAYRSGALDTVVLHRIVDVDDQGYVTSGDNNDWLDPDRPTDEDILGTARLRIPQAGRLLEVPVPARAAVVTALAALALFGGSRRRRRGDRRPAGGAMPSRRRRGRRTTAATRRRHAGDAVRMTPSREMPSHEPTPHEPTPHEPTPPEPTSHERSGGRLTWIGWPAATVAAATMVALAAAILGVAAFTSSATAPGELHYSHRGAFDYTTPAPAGLVYPDGQVSTGEPVFLRLVDRLDLTYTHELDAPAQATHTVGRLWLELSDDSGWTHRTPLGDQRETTDGPLVLEGTLDVPAVRRLFGRIREEAGISGARQRTDIVAEVDVEATVSGEELSDEVSDTLGFELEEHRLVPRMEDDDPTVTTQEATMIVGDLETARLEVAGRGLDVPQARTVSVVLLTLALGALVVAVVGAARRGRLDEPERLRLRYGAKLVEVTSLQPPTHHGVAMVGDVAVLADLADLAERPILHHREGNVHTYVVDDETTQYRCRIEVPDQVAEDVGAEPVEWPAPDPQPPEPTPAPRTPAPTTPPPQYFDPQQSRQSKPAVSEGRQRLFGDIGPPPQAPDGEPNEEPNGDLDADDESGQRVGPSQPFRRGPWSARG